MRKSVVNKALALVLALAMVAIVPLTAFANTGVAVKKSAAAPAVNKAALENAINSETLNGEVDESHYDSNGWVRIYGKNRYDTSYAIAEVIMDVFGGDLFANCVVASGENYPDALGAGVFSYDFYAPILLTNKNYYQDAANVVCHNLMEPTGKAFVFGGTGAVPAGFESAFKSQKYSGQSMIRFAGTSRYDTNLKGLKYYVSNTEYENPLGNLLICSGKGYADSLSASATGWPIMLVGDSLTADQKTFLQNNRSKIGSVTFVGGYGAVNQTVEKQVKAAVGGDSSKYDRLAGASRYETSYLIAEDYFDSYNVSTVVLAYAQNYPDGLSGAPLCFAFDGPMLLCDSNHMDYVKKYIKNSNVEMAVALGGSKLISNSALNSLGL